MNKSNREVMAEGVRDGLPIALGYLVVSFTLGIAAKNAGLTPFMGFLASFLNNASAGEYAGFTCMAGGAPYWEIAVVTLVANGRYLLMSCVVSQKFSPETSFWHRIGVGFDLTDEIFGITVARKGYVNPYYNYGAMLVALPGWSVGTALGIMAGEIMAPALLSALSVALYGMFIAIIVPPARTLPIIGVLILISFALSFACTQMDFTRNLSAGNRVIILTLLIAGVAAKFFPIKK